jgi:hypothetical protein
MELRMRPNTSPSRVDHASRARIAIALHEDLEQVADLEGEVEGVEDRRSTFALKLSDRRTVSVPFERAEKADVVEALDRRPVARVRVRGRVQWSTPPKLLEVNELEVFDHERRPEIDALWKRIDSLAEVPNGWLDGDGLAPSAEALARVREVLARLLADHHEIPRPKVFPTPEGGLQAEWVFGCVSADACFQRDGLTVCSAVSTAHERELDATFEENEVTRFDAALLAQWLMKARSL